MDPEARGRRRVKGEVVAFGKLFAALTTLKRRDRVSEFDVAIYEDRTAHIPLAVLSRAVTTWLDTEQWFPTIQELLAACEKARCQLRGAVTFTICEREDGKVCSRDGWIEQVVDGIHRAVRCPCWHAHQAKVQQLGAGDVPLALPAAEAREMTQVSE